MSPIADALGFRRTRPNRLTTDRCEIGVMLVQALEEPSSAWIDLRTHAFDIRLARFTDVQQILHPACRLFRRLFHRSRSSLRLFRGRICSFDGCWDQCEHHPQSTTHHQHQRWSDSETLRVRHRSHLCESALEAYHEMKAGTFPALRLFRFIAGVAIDCTPIP